MEPGFDEKQQTEGYKDETDSLKDPMREFLKQYYKQLYSGDPERNYDSGELDSHFVAPTIMRKIIKGEAKITSVETFYIEGKPDEIRVDFAREGEGAPGYLYLRGQALKDFLSEEETKT